MRQAREEKGLTIDEMSAISNLTKQVIRGIESDDYSELAGLSFVRGYLKLYAKKLGVNESDVVEPFDRWKAEQSGEPVQATSTAGVGVQEPSSGPSQGTMIAAAAVVVVLIVAGAVISYMDSDEPEPEVAVVLPQNEPSDLPLPTAPESGDNTTADQNISETAIAGAETASTESQGDQVAVAEDATETPATEKPKLAETEKVEDVAQVKKEPEPKKPVQPAEPPKVVKKVEPKVEKPVAEKVETPEERQPVVVSSGNLSQGGRVIAEASGLAPAPTEPVQTTQVSPGQDDGLRVLSETVTGPSADQLAMGARGRLEIEFTGDSWVEVRDARGRLILADLMTPEKDVNLDTYGPVEVLVGAVSLSTVTFNGETQDLKKKAYQDVARITLGAETN